MGTDDNEYEAHDHIQRSARLIRLIREPERGFSIEDQELLEQIISHFMAHCTGLDVERLKKSPRPTEQQLVRGLIEYVVAKDAMRAAEEPKQWPAIMSYDIANDEMVWLGCTDKPLLREFAIAGGTVNEPAKALLAA